MLQTDWRTYKCRTKLNNVKYYKVIFQSTLRWPYKKCDRNDNSCWKIKRSPIPTLHEKKLEKNVYIFHGIFTCMENINLRFNAISMKKICYQKWFKIYCWPRFSVKFFMPRLKKKAYSFMFHVWRSVRLLTEIMIIVNKIHEIAQSFLIYA